MPRRSHSTNVRSSRWIGEQLGKFTGFVPVTRRTRAGDEAASCGPRSLTPTKSSSGTRTRRTTTMMCSARCSEPARTERRKPRRTPRPCARPVPGRQRDDGGSAAWALVHRCTNAARPGGGQCRSATAGAAFVAETLRSTPPVWGIPRTPTKAGVTPRHGRDHDTRRGARARPSMSAASTAIEAGSTRCSSIRRATMFASKEQQRSLLPFGLGPRGCIGQHSRMAEMRAILPVLAQRGDIAIDGEVSENPSFALRVQPALTGRLLPPGAPRGPA